MLQVYKIIIHRYLCEQFIHSRLIFFICFDHVIFFPKCHNSLGDNATVDLKLKLIYDQMQACIQICLHPFPLTPLLFIYLFILFK